ncbi:MAG TPA: type II toxin-antitoxin system VapC family toxin [Devosiaceae bacterium]|nr:type II toxin-antitoxin system VapC family toxin [Devosiaceae bacterium]
MIVLDASLTLSWYFEDERTPDRLDVLQKVAGAGAVVPAHWPLEVANGFVMAVRRGRMFADRRELAFAALAALPITVDPDSATHAWSLSVDLADRSRLTVYDAAYLELSLRRKLSLATLDMQLAQAARSAGVAVLPS